MPRHSDFTQEKADIICERLEEGRSLRSICTDKDMPSKGSVLRWLIANESFQSQYARAKEIGAEAVFEEIRQIADDGSNDTYKRVDAQGNEIETVNHDHINRSRLRIDTRKWQLSKQFPKKYGEKLEVENTGNITITITQAQAAIT